MADPAVSGLVVAAIWLVAVVLIAIFPTFMKHTWLTVANAVTFGWYGRLEQRPVNLAPDPCTHWQAVAVREFMTGDVVAWLCPDCDKQLATKPPLALPPLPPFVADPQPTGVAGR